MIQNIKYVCAYESNRNSKKVTLCPKKSLGGLHIKIYYIATEDQKQ